MNTVFRRAATAFVAALIVLSGITGTHGAVLAWSEGDDPKSPKEDEWRDIRCPEPDWPYYLYRFPMLISDDSGDERQWLGWYYVNACARQLTPDGKAVGDTYSNLPVADIAGIDAAALNAFLAAGNADLKVLGDVLNEIKTYDTAWAILSYFGGSEFTRSYVPNPLAYSDRFRRLFGLNIAEPLPTYTVPSLRDRMADAGFATTMGWDRVQSTAPATRTEYILIGSSRQRVGPNAVIDWWDVHGQGPFFAYDPAGAAVNLGATGGIGRIALFPVDWEMMNVEQTGTDGDNAVVRATVRLTLSSRRRQTAVGWRWQDEGPNAPWNIAAGDAKLEPGWEGPKTFRVPLPSQPRVLEVKVNPYEDRPAHEIDYTNNTMTIAVRPAHPNLAASDIWYSPASPNPGDAVKVSVAVRNDNSGGYGNAIDTVIAWSMDGKEMGRVPLNGLAPGEERRVTLGTFTAPNKATATVRAEVNPDRNAPADESGWGDNAAQRDVVMNLTDLDISLNSPPEVTDNMQNFPVGVSVGNRGTQTVTARVVVRQNGRVVWDRPVTVPARGRVNIRLDFTPGRAGTIHTFEGVVDPDNRIAESKESNNRSTTQTRVRPGPVPQPDPPPSQLESWLIGD